MNVYELLKNPDGLPYVSLQANEHYMHIYK